MLIILAAAMAMGSASDFEIKLVDYPVPHHAHRRPVKGDVRITGPKGYVWVKPRTEIDATMVSDANIEGRFVRIDLTDGGRAALSRISRIWTFKSVAALINHKVVYTSPIFSPIDDGRFLISGDFDSKDAQRLVIQIRAAAHLPPTPRMTKP